MELIDKQDYEYLINCNDILTTCQEALIAFNINEPCQDGQCSKQAANCGLDGSTKLAGHCPAKGSGKKCDEKGLRANSMIEFALWLDRVEKQLDNVCYCSLFAAKSTNSEMEGIKSGLDSDKSSSNTESNEIKGNLIENKLSSSHSDSNNKSCNENLPPKNDHESKAERSSSFLCPNSSSSSSKSSAKNESQNNCKQLNPDATKSNKNGQAKKNNQADDSNPVAKVNNVEGNQKILTAKKSPQPKVWTLATAIEKQKAIQQEVESVGRRFISAISASSSGAVGKLANQSASSPSGSSKGVPGRLRTLFAREESRWHSIWLKSLEFLMILESGKECPRHFGQNMMMSNYRRPETPKTLPLVSKHNYTIAMCSSSASSGCGSSIDTDSASCGTPSPMVAMGSMARRNRRIQTMMTSSAMADLDDMRGHKFEIVHKDIGYSSDADMSDACESKDQLPRSSTLASLSSCGTAGQHYRLSNGRKKVTARRRRSRRRPWSFHGSAATAEWTDWDYYQPPSLIEYNSSEDLSLSPFDDETKIRSLTEFGENYADWFKPQSDDDLDTSNKNILESTRIEECCPEEENEVFKSQSESKSTETESLTGDVLPDKLPVPKSSRRRKNFAIFLTASLISLFFFFFISSSSPPHVVLSYPRQPPPV